MRLKQILRHLNNMHLFDLVEFKGYGFAPIGYLLTNELVEEVESEPIGDAFIEYFEARNNVVTIHGLFKEYIINKEGKEDVSNNQR